MDNDFDIYCPACGTRMTKIFMKTTGFCVDICLDGCGGLYFDNREFSKVDEKHENIDEIIEVIKGRTFKPVNTAEKRKCPCCAVNMVKNFSSINKVIEIDECYSCGGKFLDYSELEKIRAEYDNDEQRVVAMLNEVDRLIGKDLNALKEEVKQLKDNRSPLKKLFDSYFGM